MKIIAARVRVAVRVDSVMKLLQRKQFPGPPPPQQAAGLVLLIVQVAPLPPPHEMMDQFSHFTRTQDRHNTLIMLLLVNTPTSPHPGQRCTSPGTGDWWYWRGDSVQRLPCRGTSPAPALWTL